MAIVLDGLAYGLQLALLAVGLTMIYGLGGVLNLAHGQYAVVAALVSAVLVDRGAPTAAALAAGVGGACVLAVVTNLTVLRAAYDTPSPNARVLRSLLLTVALAFVIDGVAVTLFPFTSLALPLSGGAVDVLGVPMRRGSLAAAALASSALVVVFAVLRYTTAGRVVRATIADEQGAQLCGIDPGRVRTAVAAIGGALAAFAAIGHALNASTGSTDGNELTILALIVTVVGGLGSIAGATLAGLLLGLVAIAGQVYVGSYATYVLLLLTAIVTIVVRPAGLLRRGT